MQNIQNHLYDFECSASQLVTFTAVDECGNADESCQSTVTFSNTMINLDIDCPAAIEVECNSDELIPAIERFLLSFDVVSTEGVVSEDSIIISTDLDIEIIDPECTQNIIQDVTFTITEPCGVQDTCVSQIEYIPAAQLYVPNIFNPSASGDDSRFAIRSNTVDGESLIIVNSFRIYSRWGDLMFERENFDPNAEPGWDGKDDLGRAVQGVYIYHIDYIDTFGNIFPEEIGSLTIWN